jgi:hypothetical protein
MSQYHCPEVEAILTEFGWRMTLACEEMQRTPNAMTKLIEAAKRCRRTNALEQGSPSRCLAGYQ